ncbi:MAG: GNAT family N-acetyltransferase [Legionella sp.]|jgi:RimJ/RimL family protein N-acetyltransferase
MNNNSPICFEKVNSTHKEIIFSWLAEPHIMASWDTSQGHKDDINNFIEGRVTPSSYANGKYVYWIAKENNQPFSMIMSIQESVDSNINDIKLANLSATGSSYSLDFMIGNKDYYGKGYGARTLSEFIDFFRKEFDPTADTFLIDPAIDNLRAKHVYMKAGFKHVGDFIMIGEVSSAGIPHHLLIKRLLP